MDVASPEAEHLRQPVPSQIRTARTSIQDLPSELLAVILYYSTQLLGPCLARVQALGTVCSRWREVVKGTPKLWSRIRDDDPPGAIERAIRQSKNAPLDIGYDFMWSRRRKAEMERPFALICAHMERWSHARIALAGIPEGLFKSLAAPVAPGLEGLCLQVYREGIAPIIPFQGDLAPLLHELDLHGMLIEWGRKNQFRNLRILNISTNNDSRPSLPELIKFLPTLPKLENFGFEGDLQPPGSDGTAFHYRIILPHLKYLSIKTKASVGAVDISSCLRAPACQNITLEGDLERDNVSDALARAIHHFIPIVHSEGTLRQRFTIALDQSSSDFWTPNARFSFSADSLGVEIAHWMLDNLPNEEAQIALDARLPGLTARHFVSMLSAESPPNITRLDLSMAGDRGSAVIQDLSSPLSTVGELSRWPLPHLRNLSLSCHSNCLVGLLHMLRARAGTSGATNMTQPASLKTLDIRGYKDSLAGGEHLRVELEELMKGNGGLLACIVGF
ncbi:hypothetical protein FRC01_006855 [Tulasnella sp. 417]|nr:hypothetical protein FRC01_006855 [Tulasnella sp. 417]